MSEQANVVENGMWRSVWAAHAVQTEYHSYIFLLRPSVIVGKPWLSGKMFPGFSQWIVLPSQLVF